MTPPDQVLVDPKGKPGARRKPQTPDEQKNVWDAITVMTGGTLGEAPAKPKPKRRRRKSAGEPTDGGEG